MKYLVIFLVLIGFAGLFLNGNHAYGLWVPQSPQELMEQSKTVFVGNITSVNILEFERSNTYNVEENGVSRIIIENYTQTLDEYTVDIEEFLKNPQTSNTITMLEATVGGVPGRSVSIGGFELGDRVLFYVPKIDGTNQYAPESFKIPEKCDAANVLEKPRIDGFNNFYMMQGGVEMNDNFTANIPLQFSYDRDVGTLFGQSFDVSVGISKVTDSTIKNIFQKQIQVNVEPCEWVGSAKWDFVPTEGKYRMSMQVFEGTGRSGSSIGFSVLDSIDEIMSPLKQFNSGISLDEIECKNNLVLIQKYDDSPACVTEQTKIKLIERGWTEQITDVPSKYEEMHDLKKLLTENNINYLPDKLVVNHQITLFAGDPACGAVVDTDSNIHWFGIDSVSNPRVITVYDKNPNQCVVNTHSCFCDIQIEMDALTINNLDYFTPEEQEKYANILIDYLYEENINRTPKFMIGKHNVNYTDPTAVGYCGKIWGTNTYGYFSGAVVNGEVRDYGIDKELPLLCAITDDAQYFGKVFGDLKNEN